MSALDAIVCFVILNDHIKNMLLNANFATVFFTAKKKRKIILESVAHGSHIMITEQVVAVFIMGRGEIKNEGKIQDS